MFSIETKPLFSRNSEETAFVMDCFPCNSRPFLSRMLAILEDHHVTSPGSLPAQAKVAFRACLLIVWQQTHGQLSDVNASTEWDTLSRIVKDYQL